MEEEARHILKAGLAAEAIGRPSLVRDDYDRHTSSEFATMVT